TSFTLLMTRAVLVPALRPAARSLEVADFTFLVIARRLAATLRLALEALRLNLLMALPRLLPLLRPAAFRPPRFAPPRDDFFADRFAFAAITATFGLKCASVLANSLSFGSNTTNPATGFISGCRQMTGNLAATGYKTCRRI